MLDIEGGENSSVHLQGCHDIDLPRNQRPDPENKGLNPGTSHIVPAYPHSISSHLVSDGRCGIGEVQWELCRMRTRSHPHAEPISESSPSVKARCQVNEKTITES